MNIMLLVTLAIIIIFILLVISYILTYNKIQKNVVRINEAESNIDESLRKKYDILFQMENIINEQTQLKQNNFSDIDIKSKYSSFDVDRKLTKIEDTFDKIRADYSAEFNLESINNLVIELKRIREKLDASKYYYNKYTTKLNIIIKKFPTNIVARIHGINERMYFDNKNMNDEDIFDFKI